MRNKYTFRKKLLLGMFFLWIITTPVITGQTPEKDILLLRKKFVQQTMDRTVKNGQIEDLIQTFRNDSTWPDINYKDVGREAFEHRHHLSNLEVLSLAYRKEGSKYKGNKKVKEIIDKGLAYWIKNDFHSDNWYYNQIGTPLSLTRILFTMDEALTPEQVGGMLPIAGRAHMNASGARPSGDRIKIAGIQAQVALFEKDEPTLKEVIKIIEGEIKFSTGRGMKQDYSFHHRTDGVNNTVNYGLNYAETFTEWAYMVAETSFRFSDKAVNQLIDFYLDGICKQMVYGRMKDMGILNRDISRRNEIKVHSTLIPKRLSHISTYRREELENVIRAREGKPFEKIQFATHYWLSDHFVFQSPLYYASVRMYSNRNANMEEPYNGEGFYNHFRGDGTNHISVTGEEYNDIALFLDWRKIPGATTLNRTGMPPEEDLQKQGLTDFVGAVTDGLYGAAAFDFISPHEHLRAKKAWFFFEDAYVCLGTGIYSSAYDAGAITTVNQCLLQGNILVGRRDGCELLKKDTEKEVMAQWVLHDGIGYYFPEPTPVTLSNRILTGSFSDISRQASASKEKKEKELFTLWIHHKKPTRNESYCYMVIPGANQETMDNWATGSGLHIVSNTSSLQAVYSSAKHLGYGVFHKGGVLSVEGKPVLEVDHPGLVLVHYDGEKVRSVTVSDPTGRLSRFHLSLPYPVQVTGNKCKVIWDEGQKKSFLAIDLPQGEFAGQSVTVEMISF